MCVCRLYLRLFVHLKHCYFVILQAMIDESVNDEYLRCLFLNFEMKKNIRNIQENFMEFSNYGTPLC